VVKYTYFPHATRVNMALVSWKGARKQIISYWIVTSKLQFSEPQEGYLVKA